MEGFAGTLVGEDGSLKKSNIRNSLFRNHNFITLRKLNYNKMRGHLETLPRAPIHQGLLTVFPIPLTFVAALFLITLEFSKSSGRNGYLAIPPRKYFRRPESESIFPWFSPLWEWWREPHHRVWVDRLYCRSAQGWDSCPFQMDRHIPQL